MNCPKCRHPWRKHESEIKLGPSYSDPEIVHECGVGVGMGDWCGCREKRPEGWSDVEDVIAQIETQSTQLIDPQGSLTAYLIGADAWRTLRSQLRRGA